MVCTFYIVISVVENVNFIEASNNSGRLKMKKQTKCSVKLYRFKHEIL